jgi:hypothetical protein
MGTTPLSTTSTCRCSQPGLHDVEFKEPSEVAEELVRDDDDDTLREASLDPAVEGIIEQIMGDDDNDDSKPSDRLWAESLDTAIKAAVERLTSDTDALWYAYLDRILWDASYLDKPEQLNKKLAWALLSN